MAEVEEDAMAEVDEFPELFDGDKPDDEQPLPNGRKFIKCFLPACIMNTRHYPWRRFARLPRMLKSEYCKGLEIQMENRMYVCDRHYVTDDIDWVYSTDGPNSIPRLKNGIILKSCPRPARNRPWHFVISKYQNESSASDFSSDDFSSDLGTDSDSTANTSSTTSSLKSVDQTMSNESENSLTGISDDNRPESSVLHPRDEMARTSPSDFEVEKYFYPNEVSTIRQEMRSARRRERRARTTDVITGFPELGECSKSQLLKMAVRSQALREAARYRKLREAARSGRRIKFSRSQMPDVTYRSPRRMNALMSELTEYASKSQRPGDASTSQRPGDASTSQRPEDASTSQGPGDASTSQEPGETALSSRVTGKPAHSSQATSKTVKKQGRTAKPKPE